MTLVRWGPVEFTMARNLPPAAGLAAAVVFGNSQAEVAIAAQIACVFFLLTALHLVSRDRENLQNNEPKTVWSAALQRHVSVLHRKWNRQNDKMKAVILT